MKKKLELMTSNRYINLREGHNIPLIIGTIATIIILLLLGTSKFWLPDDREVMTYDKNEIYNFAMLDITPPQVVYYDDEKEMLEFEFTELHMSDSNDFDVNYTLSAVGYEELPNEVIFGNLKNDDETGTTKTRKVLIQVRVPKNFYYISVKIEQPDNTEKTVDIDYRNVTPKKLDYKGKDYLKNMEKE